MGKVNWSEAETLYIGDGRITYDFLAKKYGVAKSTIQRHAKTHEWPDKRFQFKGNSIQTALQKNLDKSNEVDERHISILKAIQGAGLRAMDAIQNSQASEYSISELSAAARTITKAIEDERRILGIAYLPVAQSPQERRMEEYRNNFTYKSPTLEQIEERKRRLDRLKRTMGTEDNS